MLGPSHYGIVLVLKVLFDTLATADRFNLARSGIDQISIYPDVAALQDASDDKIFAVGTNDPVVTVLRKRARLNNKAIPTLAGGLTAAKDKSLGLVRIDHQTPNEKAKPTAEGGSAWAPG